MADIVETEGVMGGQPRTEGRRISVRQIVEWIRTERMTPETVSSEFDLALADIYRALAYYYDNVGRMRELRERRCERERCLRDSQPDPDEPLGREQVSISSVTRTPGITPERAPRDGHAVTTARAELDGGYDDAEVLMYASEKEWVVLTDDEDFTDPTDHHGVFYHSRQAVEPRAVVEAISTVELILDSLGDRVLFVPDGWI